MGIMHGIHKASSLAHRAAQVSGEGLHDKRLQLIGKANSFAQHQVDVPITSIAASATTAC